jgi:hypothetical protein
MIVKDPIAALSSDWLARKFDFEVDVLVRHPAAFAASLKRFNWRHPFGHFLTQEMLMERYLDPYRAELESKPENIAEQAAIIWECIYGVLFAYVDSNANLLVKETRGPVRQSRGRARESVQGTRARVDQDWTKTVEADVVKYTRSGNPVTAPEGTVHQIRRDSAAIVSRWKEILTKEEIARVYEITRPVCDSLYSDEDWGDFSR